ncbi:AraC family transcriptional regulator [Ancylobacter sp. MQZ15Z-1]|uniref:AraC family transcriptional regulator n=1 Tax=Ancylobacter mangrovi TaxID=2972472 RepID=A0A9X2T5Y8_9HYPH|nr:AraC family transcriptional regulator [Ancylobacter mangrovi]MCS0497781.1 AraC family transcriptional regulator [Ancylobacter mangrovi]
MGVDSSAALTGVSVGAWQRFEVHQIEQFRNAVLGASLDAALLRGPLRGASLAFAAGNGFFLSSGLVQGNIAVSGNQLDGTVILVANVRTGPRTLLALEHSRPGDIAAITSGFCLNAHYGPGDIYLALTLSAKRFEQQCDVKCIHTGVGGLLRRALSNDWIAWVEDQLLRIHTGETCSSMAVAAIAKHLLESVTRQTAAVKKPQTKCHAAIVEQSRDYIQRNLSSRISMDALATVAGTSRRTLFRAFGEVLNATPQSYVRIVRLNRIRQQILSTREADQTISALARSCGIGELGRLASWYRALFGEYPHETRKRNRSRGEDMFL